MISVMRIVAGVVGLIAVVLAQPSSADACSCMPPPPPCARMFFGPVFVGRAIKVVQGKGTQKTTFSVSEVFHGAIGKTAVVSTGTDDGSCGKSFDLGTEYIVYADGTAADLSTGSCSGTRLVGDAKEDLAFGRSIPQRLVGSVDGIVDVLDEGGGSGRAPLAGVEVRVRGTKLKAKSGASGAFHFDLAPGKYSLEVVSTDVVTPGRELAEIEIPVAAACAAPRIDVMWNGRIAGRVTDLAGKPMADVSVGATDAVGSLTGNMIASTAADGTYLIEGVSARSYRVGVSLPGYGGPQPKHSYPTTYFPGTPDPAKATIVTVARAKLTPKIDFSIPGPLPAFTVRGIVKSPRGKPAPDKNVSIELPESYGTYTTTDKEGRYSYEVVSGRDIVVSVCNAKNKCHQVKRRVTGPTVIDLQVPR